MAVHINHPDGIVDTGTDFALDIELTNPIYSERGSMTYPATLPLTVSNRRIFKNAQRLDIVNAPDKDVRVEVIDGVFRRVGKLNVISAGKTAGITVNIGFDEGEMYSLFEDTNLAKLNWIEEKYQDAATAAQQLQKVMTDQINANYAVFPILTGSTEVNNSIYYEYLNRPTLNPETNGWELVSAARYEDCINSGSVVRTMVPEGYGCTPFLKVHYVISQIFAHFGFRVVENPFATHHQLKQLVVLNNIADIICKGTIRYADLLPSCTINEFFNSLYARTGMIYFVDGAQRTVRIKLLKDILTQPASVNLRKYLVSDLNISFATPKRVVLTASTSFNEAAPQKNTIKQFLSQYNYNLVIDKVLMDSTGKPISPEVLNGEAPLLYERRTGRYYEFDFIDRSLKFKSSEFFAWDTEDDNIEKEEINGSDEFLPMSLVIWDKVYQSVIPNYLSGYVHHNTILSKGGSEKDNEGETPLAFCFAAPCRNVPFGTIYCHDVNGDQIRDKQGYLYDLALTFTGENGAFNRFFKEYDAILRHANSTIECDINLPRPQLFSLDLSKPVFLEGQRLMIETLKHTLPLLPGTPPTVKLRTLKLLQPFDLNGEQQITTSRPWFKWSVTNEMESTAYATMVAWAEKEQHPLVFCKYVIDTQDYTEFPAGGDFPLKPPGDINDPAITYYYKMKVKLYFASILTATEFIKYPVIARPDYTNYWREDHS